MAKKILPSPPRSASRKPKVPSSPPLPTTVGQYCPYCELVWLAPVYDGSVPYYEKSERPKDSADRAANGKHWRKEAHDSAYDCVAVLRSLIEAIKNDVESINEWRRR